MNAPQKLIPLGTRISHWGGKGGHGNGTIIAYNGVSENSYLRNNFAGAVELAAKAGVNMLSTLVDSMYDGGRYPYVVQFDPRVEEENEHPRHVEIRQKYPRGYKDVYTGGNDSTELTLIDEPNIFPNNTVRRMGRCWENNQWSDWAEVSDVAYMLLQDDNEKIKNCQFCVR